MDDEPLFIEELDGITGATPEEASEAYVWREPEYDAETYDFRR